MPVDRLHAVTFDSVTFIVCGACVVDAVAEADRLAVRVTVEPFIARAWSK